MYRNRFILAAMLVMSFTGAQAQQVSGCTASNPNFFVEESTPTAAFTDNHDGTVTHALTGLMWKRCAEGLTTTACAGSVTTMTWAQALAAAKDSTFAGYSDWRLPNIKELDSIVETCGYSPSINQTLFPATPAGDFWSATSDISATGSALLVSFVHGGAISNSPTPPPGVKTNVYPVRLVRGGQFFDAFDAQPSPVFVSATANGSTLVMTYSAILDAAHIPVANAFTVKMGNTQQTPTAVAVNANAKTVTLTLATPVVNGDTVTVSYTDPTSGNDVNAIQDAAGNDAATITDQAVTNNTAGTLTVSQTGLYPLGNEETANLKMVFTENVAPVSGKNIVILQNTTPVETITLPDSRVHIWNTYVWIDPNANLSPGHYYVNIDSGAFTGASSGNPYAGITDPTTWMFDTVADTTPPTLLTWAAGLDIDITSLMNSLANQIPVSSSGTPKNILSFVFNENVTAVSDKKIRVKKASDNTEVESFDATAATKVMTIMGTVVSVTPFLLQQNTAYYVTIDPGAFLDTAPSTPPNSFAGISDTSLSFTTAANPLTPVFGAALSTAVTSNSFNVSPAGSISIACPAGDTACGYSINGALYISASDTVANGDTVTVKVTSSSAYSTTVTATLSVDGGVIAGMSVTTMADPNSGCGNCGGGGIYYPPPPPPGPILPPPGSTPPPPPPIQTPGGFTVPITAPNQVINNPPPNVTVDTSGAIVITAPPPGTPGQPAPIVPPIVISQTAPENALVKLPPNQPVAITAGQTTLTYTDKQGGAQLLIRPIDGQPHIEVASGVVAITSTVPGNVIPVISVNLKSVGTVTTATDTDSVVVVKSDKSAVVFVDTGIVTYKGTDQAAPGVTVYNGENAKLDNATGQLSQITLGSHNGENQVPGDPLPPQQGYAADTVVPGNLDANLSRFKKTVSVLDILRDAIEQVLGDASGSISYDKTTGVVTYILGGNHGYRLIPLGEILVQLNQLTAASVSATASGAYNLVSQGIQMTLSGTVGYFNDLNQAVKALDSNGGVTLKPSGTLEMSLSGNRYAGIPGLAASLPAQPTPIPGFEMEGGVVVFRDHFGVIQTIYPAFLEADSVTAILKAIDPAANLTNNGNGTLAASVSGQAFTFSPEYRLTTDAASHPSQTWWMDGNLIYIRYGDSSVQGFKLQ